MKALDFPAVKMALLLILGILLGYKLNLQPFWCLSISVMCLLVLALIYFLSPGRSFAFGITAAVTTLSIGLLSYALSREINHSGHYQEHDLSQKRLWHLKIRKPGKHTSFYRVYNASILSLDEKIVRGNIQLRIKQSESPPLDMDDEILVWGRAEKITAALNPFQWDYARYMAKRNIYHQIRTDSDLVYSLNSQQRTIQGWASDLRNTIIKQLDQMAIPERELSIVKAILLGERGDITQDTFEAYRKAGAMHLLAISGLHIGILLLLLRYLCRPLNRLPGGRKLALIISVTILWGYALLAGFGPSVVRAVAMFSFLAYSLFLNRLTYGYNTLSLSLLFVLLLIDPSLLFEVGFQMSYAAVAAILWVYPILMRLWQPRATIVKRVWQAAGVSLAAQLGVLPVSLFYFHQFPGLFLLTSLVIIPFLGILLGTGFAVAFLSLINKLPEVLSEVYGLILFYLNEFIGWVSSLEAFHLENLPFGLLELILTYFLIISLIRLLKRPGAKVLAHTLTLFLWIQILSIYYAGETRNTDRIFIGHQYGHPILVRQKGHNLLLYSSGKTAHPSFIRNYQLGARTRQVEHAPLQNSYLLNGQALMRMDSNLILLHRKEIDYLWLTYSPKINLDRYLNSFSPEYIIADGSSPPYLVNRWRESAKARDIPFHYTAEQGAFEFR